MVVNACEFHVSSHVVHCQSSLPDAEHFDGDCTFLLDKEREKRGKPIIPYSSEGVIRAGNIRGSVP